MSRSKDPGISVLCCGWVKLVDGCCPTCGKVWKRENTFESLRGRFEIIVDLNRQALDSLTKSQLDHIIIPIKIRGSFYAVPFSLLKEFDGMTSHERQNKLFENLQSQFKKIQFP